MPVRKLLLGSAAVLCLVAGCTASRDGAAALVEQADTVDVSLPTQLPRTAVPSRYAIFVTPHADKLSFDGKVTIALKVVKPARELVLNAADLTFGTATLTPAGGQPLTAKVSTDEAAQTVTFAFDRELAAGDYRLDVAYAGKINTQANGLFALDYKNADGKDARSLFTQFEAADARRFVPSFDEPDYKAKFDLSARVPSAEMAVSNMPAASSKDVGNGLKEVKFETSPTMSTYLLFFATGDFERISKKAGGREVGIVTSRGNGPKAQFALDAEAQILPYYNDYFGVPYALPKLDNVAGPGQSQFFGAMENWGAIFTFEKILLLDPAITSETDRQAIFSVEAHEMAHQWFGDLVTMAWWDDLWLNEGFASWMENRTTQHFHPDWGAEIDSISSREAAMGLDSFATTHPVVQQVRTVEQANQAFDTITYQKGESVISMLEGFAGSDVWREGIRGYMRKFANRNTRTGDLWAAIEGAGAKGLAAVANDFTTQPGIPLIEVGATQCVDGKTIATIGQGQFSNDQKAEAGAKPLAWHVPVRASIGGKGSAQIITQARVNRIEVPGCGLLLINPGQTGYYRTLYNPHQAEALRAGFAGLGAVDQYGLLTDALALSGAGYQPMGRALDLLAAIPADAHGKLVARGIDAWAGYYDMFDGDPVMQAAIKERILATYSPRLKALGFTPRAGEPPLDTLLRQSLIGQLGRIGDPRVVAEGERLFAAWQKDRAAIPGPLKETWLAVIARNATPANWDAIHRIAGETRGSVERAALYQMLGRARDEKLAMRALDLALTNEPGATVSAGMISAAAGPHSEKAIDFVLGHLPQVNRLVDISGRSRFIAGLAGGANSPTVVAKLNQYAGTNLAATDRRPVAQAIGTLQWRLANRPRMRAEAAEWLKAHMLSQRVPQLSAQRVDRRG